MKKASGFEKFYKGKEKTGGAKKEAIRKEKREIRKEREDKIAEAKRQKRAQYKAAGGQQPPTYNLEPPASKYSKKSTASAGSRPAKSSGFKVEKKGAGNGERFPQQNGPKRFQKEEKQGSKPRRFENGGTRNETPRRFQADENQTAKPNRFDAKKPRFEKPQRETSGRTKPTGDRPARTERFEQPKKNTFQADKEKRNSTGRKLQPLKPELRENAGAAPAKTKAPVPAKPLTDQMPLNKYIAHSGVCSRRDAVDIIKAGKVKVNGELVLEPGYKVALTDDVKVGGRKMNPVKDFVYILLNKPKDYITTTDDPQQRKTVLDLLSGAPDIRIYPVGRLDRNTSGVLLLTNDGDLSQKLTHPSHEIKKVYAVTLDKPLTRHHFDEILKGVPLEDGPANVDVLAYADTKDHTQIGVEIHSGRNRIVRRIFEHFGYEIKALDRVIFAGLTKKNVNRGKWRFLTEKEVRDLKFFRKGR